MTKSYEEQLDEAAEEYAKDQTEEIVENLKKDLFIWSVVDFKAGAAWGSDKSKVLLDALTKIKDVYDEYGVSPTEMMILAEATNALKQYKGDK